MEDEQTDATLRTQALTLLPSREEIARAAIEPPQEWIEEEWSDNAG